MLFGFGFGILLFPYSRERGNDSKFVITVQGENDIIFVITMDGFASRLKTARENAGFSQRSLAIALGIAQPSYARYETTDLKRFVYPGTEILERICRSLNISSDWLLGIDSHPPANTVVATGGSAVAIGPGAKAAAGHADAAPADCSKCPHLKELQRLKKRLASLANG